jgi:4-hydroxybutyrate CoA-transferase
MGWEEEYKRKLITAEEATNFVKSGDRVVFPLGREAFAIGLALAARKDELTDVEVFVPFPGHDFGWYDPGWEDSFNVSIMAPTETVQEAIDERRCDVVLPALIPDPMTSEETEPDVAFVEISDPDELGFCSFGASLWDKKRRVQQSKLVIAEVNPNLIRTFGDNFVHVSQIDYFVEHVRSGGAPGMGSLAGRILKEPAPHAKPIAEYVGSLIQDGDTIQIGVGRTNESLVKLGMLDGKHDIGYHSEATPRGIIHLVKEGVINGKRKTLNVGKCVVTSIGGSTKEEMAYVHNNPLFHLVDVDYLEDITVIAAHEHFVAINQALAIDLTGQIAAESLGTRLLAGAGGQIPFVFGALLSKGGRSITVIPSTAASATVSRITPLFPQGTVVTIQRNCVDYVVTEYGIARLKGKSIRKRAEALISIAHPDFRKDLKEEAERLYWP